MSPAKLEALWRDEESKSNVLVKKVVSILTEGDVSVFYTQCIIPHTVEFAWTNHVSVAGGGWSLA